MSTFILPEIQESLKGFSNAKVAIIGDFCLDLYEIADMRLSELSRETPLFPYPIIEERFSAGGAGNVAVNMAALQPEKLTIIGLTGNDWRAPLLRSSLKQAGLQTDFLFPVDGIFTNTYMKTLRKGISSVVYEASRLDFENHHPISHETEELLVKAINQADYDVLAVSDQLKFGSITPYVREAILQQVNKGKKVIVDSRERIHLYPGCIIKPNELEAAKAFGKPGESLPEERTKLPGFAMELLKQIVHDKDTQAIITLGDQGCVFWNEKPIWHPGYKVTGETDVSGAGDTFLAALCVGMASGLSIQQTIPIASLASAVTVQKIGITGTATREEIIALAHKWEDQE